MGARALKVAAKAADRGSRVLAAAAARGRRGDRDGRRTRVPGRLIGISRIRVEISESGGVERRPSDGHRSEFGWRGNDRGWHPPRLVPLALRLRVLVAVRPELRLTPVAGSHVEAALPGAERVKRRLAVAVAAPHGDPRALPARATRLRRALLRDLRDPLEALHLVRVSHHNLGLPLRAHDVTPAPVPSLFESAELHRTQDARDASVHRHLLLARRFDRAGRCGPGRREHRGGVRLTLIRRVLTAPAHPRFSVIRLTRLEPVTTGVNGQRASRASHRLRRERLVRGARANRALTRTARRPVFSRGVHGVNQHRGSRGDHGGGGRLNVLNVLNRVERRVIGIHGSRRE